MYYYSGYVVYLYRVCVLHIADKVDNVHFISKLNNVLTAPFPPAVSIIYCEININCRYIFAI